ncbi:UvrD-like helicase domain protein [Acinetobacter baumannii OIFC0162]|nr:MULTISPECIES: ATP-binding domain-containing protein [Acinetobacter]EHU1481980.1 DEAD/DEAH box helicase [Acinetobacter baumannii]EHU2604602.1 DEAD/DEAH box helicase [Acinetobacter baumannii]EHU2702495.1 DEAD/DEAH box helicase [Acinetobacter baumannii]EIB6890803.1 DEAD/DEAH box helicase [Acinetobacter baumannii]EKK14024.1 UvrD-like helicase domain protein [Acinetobacter baumannii OIFC0162]
MDIPSKLYIQDIIKDDLDDDFIEGIISLIDEKCSQAYLLRSPLNEKKYNYYYDQDDENPDLYNNGFVFLQPGYPIVFISIDDDEDALYYYGEQFILDVNSLSDKFRYDKYIGRQLRWRKYIDNYFSISNLNEYFELKQNNDDKRKTELLISLIIGSINQIDNISLKASDNLLDKVKNKIQLFDGDQTRFIYDSESDLKMIRIQGLSGSGKTELLLHKLKEIYLKDGDSKILFTCHNKILSNSLKNRIPSFFNFMKVEVQIDWEKLLCVHAWGSTLNPFSGAYRYICEKYDLNFYTFSRENTFDKVCKVAIKELKDKIEGDDQKIFDYVFVDESQDFPKSFIELINLVTKKQIYIAGDVFQNIFDNIDYNSVEPNFLLKKCYRTDPRTLMIAHGMGLGVFEEKAIKTLTVNEWKACGYNVIEHNEQYELSRDPTRRFEDLESESIVSFEMLTLNKDIYNKDLVDNIFQIINLIREENSTVTVSDIGIVFIDRDPIVYNYIEYFCAHLGQLIEWNVNNAIKSKDNIGNQLFVSNINNVKGLEFPFVICISNTIKNDASYRNSLYMTLTRSFLKTYFVVGKIEDNLRQRFANNIENITSTKKMFVNIQQETLPESLTIDLKSDVSNYSLADFIKNYLKDVDIESSTKNKIYKLTKGFYDDSNMYKPEEVEKFINDLIEKL